MSTSFRPNEAKEDQHALSIIAAFFLSSAMLLFAYQTSYGGLKYIVLTTTGVEKASIVLSVVRIGSFSTEDIIEMGASIDRDFSDNVDEVTVSFVDHRGEQVVNAYLVPSHQNTVRENDEVVVVSSRLNSEIFLPAETLPSYRIDGWIFSIASGVIAVCALWVLITIRRWRTFRAKARRY